MFNWLWLHFLQIMEWFILLENIQYNFKQMSEILPQPWFSHLLLQVNSCCWELWIQGMMLLCHLLSFPSFLEPMAALNSLEPMTTLNDLDPRVLETEIARMGEQEWRFIADFPEERWISFQMPIRSGLVAACWQSPWTGALLRCGVAPARHVPTEGTGAQGSVLLGKGFPILQLSLGS